MADIVTEPIPVEEAIESKVTAHRFSFSTLIAYGLIFGFLALLGWGLVQVNKGQVDE